MCARSSAVQSYLILFILHPYIMMYLHMYSARMEILACKLFWMSFHSSPGVGYNRKGACSSSCEHCLANRRWTTFPDTSMMSSEFFIARAELRPSRTLGTTSMSPWGLVSFHTTKLGFPEWLEPHGTHCPCCRSVQLGSASREGKGRVSWKEGHFLQCPFP